MKIQLKSFLDLGIINNLLISDIQCQVLFEKLIKINPPKNIGHAVKDNSKSCYNAIKNQIIII